MQSGYKKYLLLGVLSQHSVIDTNIVDRCYHFQGKKVLLYY